MLTIKKMLCFALCGTWLATSFTGCAPKSVSQSGGVSTVTIWSGATSSKIVYDKLINEYNQGPGKEKGIKIDYIVKDGGSLTQNVELALQSGQAPEMFAGGSFAKMVENGDLAAIDDLPGGQAFLEKYDGLLIKDVNTYNDKAYTVPVSASPQGLVYNKDMFRAAGLVDESGEPTPPKTFRELREYAKKLTNPSKKEYGIIFPLKWDGWFGSDVTGPMMSSVGHAGFNPVTGEYDYSGLVPIMETILAIKKDGSCYPGAEGLDNDPARALFATGGVGMKFAFAFDVGVYNDQFPAEIDWGVAPYPVVDPGSTYKQRMDYFSTYYINAKAVEKVGGDKLMEVLRYFTGNEFITKTYQEGVEMPYDWEIVKDVKIENPKTGWVDFCELVAISARYPRNPKTDMTGQVTLKDRFMNEVWTEKLSPAEALEDYGKVMTEARARFYKNNPALDPSEYLVPDWNIKR